MSKLKLYSSIRSKRLTYTIDFISENFLTEQIDIIDVIEKNESAAVINYTSESRPGCLNLEPEGLLFEQGVHSKPVIRTMNEEHEDVLSVVFFNISRYEEYQIKERDEHGRFSFRSLTKEKQGSIKKPFLDHIVINWVRKLENYFQRQFLSTRDPLAICTFDIDIAYAYKGRGNIRNIGSKLKDILSGEKDRISERRSVLEGKVKDPFDTYDLQEHVSVDLNIETRHFFLVSNDHKNDHAISRDSAEFTTLVKKVDGFSQVGIHPSYNSHKSFENLKTEVSVLEKVLENEISISRQHYLKFDLPDTLNDLIQCGIREEYSMGFADASLFRAGTCFPFLFYDLTNDNITALKVFPLSWMDSTYYYDEKMTVTDAEKRLFKVMDEILEVGGVFISNWHNNRLEESHENKPWRDLFLKMIEKLGKAF